MTNILRFVLLYQVAGISVKRDSKSTLSHEVCYLPSKLGGIGSKKFLEECQHLGKYLQSAEYLEKSNKLLYSMIVYVPCLYYYTITICYTVIICYTIPREIPNGSSASGLFWSSPCSLLSTAEIWSQRGPWWGLWLWLCWWWYHSHGM